MRKHFVSALYIVLFIFSAHAQQTLSQEEEERLYRQALEAFQDRNFSAAKPLFSKYLDLHSGIYSTEAHYYLAYTQLKTGDEEGVARLIAFISAEAGHPLAGSGYFVLGNHFFEEQEFARALRYYTQTNENQLSVDEQEEWYFKQGYSQLAQEQPEEAATAFEQTIDYYGAYQNDASYYLGQLYYDSRDFAAALEVLEPLEGRNTAYTEEVTSLIASIYFKQRNYRKLYTYVEDRVTKTASNANKTLNRLAGEAYFDERKYDLAAQYLQRFLDLSRNKAEAEVYFKLAYAYFQTSEDKRAIEYFKLSGLEKGELGQTSSFYLGQLYLRTGNLNYALSAFRKAMSAGSDEGMKEEAAFLVGKVNFDRKQHAEAISDLDLFLQSYPNSRWKTEANELLARSYLKTSDYDQAIAHLEQIPNKSNLMKAAYQKVTYQKGQLQFNDSKFQDAAKSFEKSVQFPIDLDIATHSNYLLGESYSILNQPQKAERAFLTAKRYNKSIWPVYADYGLGYIAYNEKNYASAERYFSAFLSNIHEGNDYYHDAKLRLADAKYVQKKYDEAIRLYEEIKSRSSYARDYIFYQLGLAHNLMGDQEKARVNFSNVLNQGKSSYASNALLQLAQTFIESGDFEEAVPPLSQVIREHPNSSLSVYARSRRALSYFNMDQMDKARADYQYVLENHITHPTANAALLGLQEISKRGVEISGFANYMESYRQANPDDNSLEVIDFDVAKSTYYDQKYSEAIAGLNAFIKKYPESGFMEDAFYFLADAHYRNQNWEQAAAQFEKLTRIENSAYFTRALDKRARSLIRMNKYKQAISSYRLLLRRSNRENDQYTANEGLMNAYFLSGKGDSTLYFADQILEGQWKPANAAPAAWLTKGKVYLNKKDYNAALDEFIKVINEVRNETGAEAMYLMAQVYFEQENYSRSLETLFNLNRDYATYSYWVSRSFLLIADNYLKMGELLQAEATLNSIVENSGIEEIVRMAKERLAKVEAATQEVLIKEDTVQSDSL